VLNTKHDVSHSFLIFAFQSKTCLNLAISRMKLLQNKRDVQLKQMRKEIFQFLQAGQEPIARIRVIFQIFVNGCYFIGRFSSLF
jgi:hypothetical protein